MTSSAAAQELEKTNQLERSQLSGADDGTTKTDGAVALDSEAHTRKAGYAATGEKGWSVDPGLISLGADISERSSRQALPAMQINQHKQEPSFWTHLGFGDCLRE
jgi:hypothetical protein